MSEADHLSDNLPQTWTQAPLSVLAQVQMGQSPPSEHYNQDGDGLPFFQGKAEFGELYPTVAKWCSEPKKTAEAGSILMSIRAPVGPTNLAWEQCAIGRGLAAITPREGIETKYLLYAIRRFADALAKQGTGTTFSAVNGRQVSEFTLPLAPSAEQQRIADRIEELFTDLDAGIAALERVKRNLSRYRAAVLHAAVTGRLTEEWRKEHGPPDEPASELLERILEERRKQWEEKTLAGYEAKGKKPPKNWKERYKEPEEPQTLEEGKPLPVLPDGWCWASIDQLIWDSSYGTSMKCDYEACGEAVLRIPNIAKGKLDLDDIKHATELLSFNDPAQYLQAGDILICRTNGSIRLIGKAALVIDAFDSPTYFASYLIRIRAIDLSMGQHLHLMLTSSLGRIFIENHAGSSAGQHNISMSSLQVMPVPVPPEVECSAIQELVHEKLSLIESLEAEIQRGLSRANRLRQAILKAAFEGKLVPQDPDDEPASVLLERIREQAAKAPKTKRKTRKKSSRKAATT